MQSSNIVLCIILSILIPGYLSANNGNEITNPDSTCIDSEVILNTEKLNLVDSIIKFGKTFLNTRYRYGANGKSGFDCSGFTSYVYGNFGYKLHHSSVEQSKQFPAVTKSAIQSGDLVFYQGRSRNGRIGHVGIVVDTLNNGEFSFIHATTQEGITISTSSSDYYKRRYVSAARVLNNNASLPLTITEPEKEQLAAVTVPKQQEIIPTNYHAVKKGDTLYSIAKKYGLTVTELKRRNNLTKDIIQPKQQLVIEP